MESIWLGIKEGPAEDFTNRNWIANLLCFALIHNNNGEESVALKDYISRMKLGQDKIYYIISDTYLTSKNNPLLEVFRKKGINVFLMYDRVDE